MTLTKALREEGLMQLVGWEPSRIEQSVLRYGGQEGDEGREKGQMVPMDIPYSDIYPLARPKLLKVLEHPQHRTSSVTLFSHSRDRFIPKPRTE